MSVDVEARRVVARPPRVPRSRGSELGEEAVRRAGKGVDRPDVLVVGGVSRLKAVGRHRLSDLADHRDPCEAADEFAAVTGPNRVVVRSRPGRRGDRLPAQRREPATRRPIRFRVADVWLWCGRKARWPLCGR